MRRTATVGRLAASEAVKQFGTRAANVTRTEQAASEALARRQLETAKQIVSALGTMKGAAMKLGQVMSFLDVGLVPEEHREEFQRELAKLRDAAPTVSFKQMRKVIEDDLEESIADVFAEFDEEPIAAASIGQVYRARLRDDGREVAIKVQYPGVAAAVRADMQNLGLILRLLKRIAPGMDPQAIGEEVHVEAQPRRLAIDEILFLREEIEEEGAHAGAADRLGDRAVARAAAAAAAAMREDHERIVGARGLQVAGEDHALGGNAYVRHGPLLVRGLRPPT